MAPVAFSSLAQRSTFANPSVLGGGAWRTSAPPSSTSTGLFVGLGSTLVAAALFTALAGRSAARRKRRGAALRRFTQVLARRAFSFRCGASLQPQASSQTSTGSLCGSSFDPAGLQAMGRSACACGGEGLPTRTTARFGRAGSAGLAGVSWLLRLSTEATQTLDQLEESATQKLGLESVLENGDLSKICADVAHDVFTDVTTGQANLADICGDVVHDVVSGVACPNL